MILYATNFIFMYPNHVQNPHYQNIGNNDKTFKFIFIYSLVSFTMQLTLTIILKIMIGFKFLIINLIIHE
jgi:hypothetical protein